jgi:transcriptional regulator with XRE-family HTH domain
MGRRAVTDALTKTIGVNLRALREKRGLSQRALGDKAGTSGGAIALWEGGLAHMRTIHLVNLAKALDVSVIQLLGEDFEGPSFDDGYAAGWAACRAQMLAATEFGGGR